MPQGYNHTYTFCTPATFTLGKCLQAGATYETARTRHESGRRSSLRLLASYGELIYLETAQSLKPTEHVTTVNAVGHYLQGMGSNI